MRRLLFAATAALGLLYHRVAGGPMDGTRWDVKIKADSFLAFGRSDTLVFDKGQVSVIGGHPEPFAAAAYSAEPLDFSSGDSVWHASLGDGERVMTWHGLVRGDTIEGVAVLWPRDGKPQRFIFKGTKRA